VIADPEVARLRELPELDARLREHGAGAVVIVRLLRLPTMANREIREVTRIGRVKALQGARPDTGPLMDPVRGPGSLGLTKTDHAERENEQNNCEDASVRPDPGHAIPSRQTGDDQAYLRFSRRCAPAERRASYHAHRHTCET
jgi:hypothetical protein